MSNVIPSSKTGRFTVGIAGYMGSGKTTCCRALTGLENALVVDGDREARDLMLANSWVHQQLQRSFGGEIFENGAISFKKLGAAVFSDLGRLRKLNAIVHPLLLERLRKTIFEKDAGVVILDAAVLPLWNIGDWLNVRIWIDAPFEMRLGRLLQKESGFTEEDIRLRMRQQEALFQPPSAQEWVHIINDRDPEVLRSAVMEYVSHCIGGYRPTESSA